jgi:spore coat protein CotH
MRHITKRNLRQSITRRRLQLEPLEDRRMLSVGPIISEFLASNSSGIVDENEDSSDWIEIHNPTPTAIDLEGYYLTDDAGDLDKWAFPDVTIGVGEFMVVFASSKDRANPVGELHTNFKLSAGGEYVGLVAPDGLTILDEYAPAYPEQFTDVSYGISQNVDTLLSQGSELSYHVPTSADTTLGTTWADTTFDDSAWTRTNRPSPILITEAGTAEVDFVEIQNVTGVPVDTTGWTVLVNDASNEQINDVGVTTWELPISMAADEILYRTDDTNNQYWGEEIRWETAGSGWVLVLDNAGEAMDFVVWGYSPTEVSSFQVNLNGRVITAGNIWSGASVAALGDSTNSLQRNGDFDSHSASDFIFVAPTTIGLQNASLTTPFSLAGTSPTTAGIGYNTHPNGFDVTLYKANILVGSLDTAESVIADPAKQSYTTSETAPFINYFSTGNSAHYNTHVTFPGLTIGTDVDNFVIEALATLLIPEAGDWTFGVNSDDGFGLELTNGSDTFTSSHPTPRGPGDTLSTFNVTTPGAYDVRLIMYERGGGASVEFFAAQGSYTSFDAAAFALVGDSASGGLSTSGFGGAIETDVETDMKDVNASIWTRIPFAVEEPTTIDVLQFQMKHNDGFIAYLNGQEVAARNAPATIFWDSAATGTRSEDDSSTWETITVDNMTNLLQTGTNVLAIHGLNASNADEEFLILPELRSISSSEERYFATPTPGEPNELGVNDFVKKPAMSVKHGIFDAPFILEVLSETPDATVRYTLDGSIPTEANGVEYAGPITVSSTSVVRAGAFKLGHEPSPVDTQTYVFLNDTINQPAAPTGFPTLWDAEPADYEMDPVVTTNPLYSSDFEDALRSLPTMSIVMDADDLFDADTGIYSNPTVQGDEWERAASLEYFDPNNPDGFQVDAGVRIYGGVGRYPQFKKHSFRFLFKDDYGPTKLDFPLFGDEAVGEFDTIILRSNFNDAWVWGGAPSQFIRDQFAAQLQLAMGQPGRHGEFVHLYINGLYWGLYNPVERPDTSFSADYMGGDKDEWDGINSGATTGESEITAWNQLMDMADAGLGTDEAYQQVQGNNPDGTNNPAYEDYLDIDNYITYLLMNFWAGNSDWRSHNWYAGRMRGPNSTGFKSYSWDAEWTVDMRSSLTNNSVDDSNGITDDWLIKPQTSLVLNSEYALRFADQAQRFMFNDGVLSPTATLAMYQALADKVEASVIAESARWGDVAQTPPFTLANWTAERDYILNTYLPQRTAIVLGQLQAAGLYPSVSAPAYNQHGGEVSIDFPLFITAEAGATYYTLDGTDPRLPGGDISPSAILLPDSSVSENLVLHGAMWNYLDDGSDQGTAWRDPDFDDSLWASGPSSLGYNNAPDTTVSFGPDSANKHITTYFRHDFTATDADLNQGLTLRLMRDDGVVVYLNGQEITRGNMPGGEITSQTLASSTVGSDAETTFYEFTIDPDRLLEGTNVLAVEVHQVSPTSSDIGFDLELISLKGQNPIILSDSTVVKSRALDGVEWSALNEAAFFVGDSATSENLAISELHYNPPAPTAEELLLDPTLTSGDFEYIEFINTSESTIDLTGVQLTDGVTFDFTGSSASPLAAGDRVLVVSNRSAFEMRYGTGILVAGEYTGQLDDDGEQLTMLDRFDQPIVDFAYNDSGVWPGRADGAGSSLEIIDPLGYAVDPDNWRSSVLYGGSPDVAGLGDFADVVVNEVLSSPTAPALDAIELFNTSASDVDIGGWWISDSSSNYEKFQIPGGTTLAAGDYLVFDENDFNSSGGTDSNDFALNANGDDVWLFETDASGVPIRFADHVDFGSALLDVSFGYWPNGTGDFVMMQELTLDAENTGARVGRVVINELHVDPDVKTEPVEFVELYNAGDVEVDLEGWYFSDGIGYTFPTGAVLPVDGYVVVSQDPATVLAKYGVTSYGPFTGRLSNEGEDVTLRDAAGIKQDEVDFQIGFPWPTVGEEPGPSMELMNPDLPNDQGGSWRSSVIVSSAEQTLFDIGSSWSYFKGVEEPSVVAGDWRLDGFSETSWQTGDASIGYGEDFIVTDLTDMRDGYSTVYLRKTINITDPSWFRSFLLNAQYDDGINVWINGTHVVSVNVPGAELPYNATASSAIENINFVPLDLGDPLSYLVAGDNVIAVQLLNASIGGSSDAFFDASLTASSGHDGGATPCQRNSTYIVNAAPQMRQVDHSPNQPVSGQDVVIEMKATDIDGVASVVLQYQLVDPGDYITIDDPRYLTQWTTLVMADDGTGSDETPGDDVYTVTLPGTLQTHRRLVRYKVTSTDTLGASVTGPYADDPQPNFAYYVYNGIPAWTASDQPGVEPDVIYGASVLNSAPVYQLITTQTAHEESQYIPDSTAEKDWSGEYLWHGALVYDGVVYDHIDYRARGGVWRYAMGKNMWKFDFNRGHGFQARDDYGNKYETTWDKLNFSAIIQQGNFLQRGEQGLFESVGFKLHNLADNPAPLTNYVQFRIVEDADESGPDQYSTDFQGVYLVVEQMDGAFLDEHELPDGNLYKMESGTGTLNNQGPTQPTDKSDLNAFMNVYKSGTPTAPDLQWWRDNLELEEYYSFRAIAMAIHDYDMHAGKNYFFYHNPETDKWSVLNWDLDLTWTTTYNGGGGDGPLQDRDNAFPPLNDPTLQIEYNNRVRELVDLLFNEEQTGMLLDEMAQPVYTAGQTSLVDADRAMWDYNPILTSSFVDSRKAGHDKFYEYSPTDDYAGMIQLLKDYVETKVDTYLAGGAFDPKVASDEGQQPNTPMAAYTGALGYPLEDLTFLTAVMTGGSGVFNALEWRIAEVTDVASPSYDPLQPRAYEATAVWESDLQTTFSDTISIPGEQLTPGQTYRVRVRMQDDAGRFSHWSDPVQFVAGSATGPLAEHLRITELMYNPLAPTTDELLVDPLFGSDDFEYVELTNTGTETLDLTGVVFDDGINYTFDAATLAPGEYLLLVANQTAFEARYGTGLPVHAEYLGELNNDGEDVTIIDTYYRTVLDFEYDDADAWPGRADGRGSSLEVIDTTLNYSDPENWRSSAEYLGTPDASGVGDTADVVVNEVLSHTDSPYVDSIELWNTTAATIDLGGWYLSDSWSTLDKFRIPDGTFLGAGELIVFDESDFNMSDGVDPTDFALDGAHGDDVWLVEANASGTLLRFVDHAEFGAAAGLVSFGLWPDRYGSMVPTKRITLGEENAGPLVHPLLISEIMYNPIGAVDLDPSDFEYIEIYNPTPETIDLAGWKFTGGIDYVFPIGASISPKQAIVVVPFDPAESDKLAAFRSHYGIGTEVTLVGDYSGSLNNGGETVRLKRPDEPPAEEPTFVPMILVDEVKYDDAAPWPLEADGLGPALHRQVPRIWGDDPPNWSALFATPGTCDLGPLVTLDLDGDGAADPLTDGLLASRYLDGLTGAPLIADILSPGATRTDSNELEEYLYDGLTYIFDVDDNGLTEAATDGLMILRHLFGYAGAQLTDGALGAGAQRTDPIDITTFLDHFLPTTTAAPTTPTGPTQWVEPTPLQQSVQTQSIADVTFSYRTDPTDATLAGLGMRLHFDSSMLAFDSIDGVLSTNRLVPGPLLVELDVDDYDQDPNTDSFVHIAWVDDANAWPGISQAPLFTAHFTALIADASTFVRTTPISTAANSLFQSQAAELIVYNDIHAGATTGDDTIRIWPGTPGGAQHRVHINGVDSYYDAAVFDEIYVDGLGGTDTLNVYGKATTENAAFNATSVHVSETSVYDVYGLGVENIYVYGGASDTAQMLGSSGNDNFYANRTYSYLRGDSNAFLNYAKNFAWVSVDAATTTGAIDNAYMYDSPGNDILVASETQATLDYDSTVTPGVDITAVGFDRVDTYGQYGGNDTATLTGSTGIDTFTGLESYSYVNGNGGAFYNYVKGFDHVTANVAVGGGADTATLYDSPGDDTLNAGQTHNVLDYHATGTPDPNVTATGFPRVSVYALFGGNDTATLTGSSGNDRFTGRETYGNMKGNTSSFINFAKGFDTLKADVSGTTGTDIAILYDAATDDKLVASETEAYFDYAATGTPDQDLTARGFDQTYSYAISGGNDTSIMNGSSGVDRFTAKATYNNLKGNGGTYFHYATGFDEAFADVTTGGGAGADLAFIYDASTDDLFTAGPTQATMDYDHFTSPGVNVTVTGFDEAYAYAESGGTDEAVLNGSSGADKFYGLATYAYFRATNDTFYNYARGFDTVLANAIGTGDLAYLYGSDGNDTLNANSTTATFTLNPTATPSVVNTANAFDQVYSYASGGGADTAYLDGTTGPDSLTADADWGILRSTGTSDYFNYVRYFDEVFADPGDEEIGNDTIDDRAPTYLLDTDPENGNVW